MSDQAMQTYHGDPAFKAAFLAQIGEHEAADALVKGTYGKMDGRFKGYEAAATNPQDHARVAADLGWPLWLAYLEDTLFESLPAELSKTWPRRLAEAIPVGAVIDDAVLAKILVWSLTSERFGIIHVTDDAEVKGWVTTIAAYITADAAGTCTADQQEAAAMAARDAWDAMAARDAWDARAAWAAWDARAAEVSEEFFAALSAHVLSVLSTLPVHTAPIRRQG